MKQFIIQSKWHGPGGETRWTDTGIWIEAKNVHDTESFSIIASDLKDFKRRAPGEYRIVFREEDEVIG